MDKTMRQDVLDTMNELNSLRDENARLKAENEALRAKVTTDVESFFSTRNQENNDAM